MIKSSPAQFINVFLETHGIVKDDTNVPCARCGLYIYKWLDFQVFSDKDDKPEVPSHNPSMLIILWDVKDVTESRARSSRCCGLSSVVYHGWEGKKGATIICANCCGALPA